MLCNKGSFLVLVFSFFFVMSNIACAENKIERSVENFFEIFDFGGRAFAYAPATIQENGVYKTIFCSSGSSSTAWDFLRYIDSDLWGNGSASVVLKPTSKQAGDGKNRSTCDPSIIKVDNWYYVYFTGSSEGWQSAIYLARTKSLGNIANYELYLGRSLLGVELWGAANGNSEPIPIVKASNKVPNKIANQNGWYGAGQQSVVKKGAVWYMWYYDDTENYREVGSNLGRIKHSIYLKVSLDGINWGRRISSFSCDNTSITTRCISSVEVRYDSINSEFVMFSIKNHHEQLSSLEIRTSLDGVKWAEQRSFCDESCFPNYAHNLGVSGDLNGHLSTEFPPLIAFGVPYKGLSEVDDNFQRPAWDLYGAFLAVSPADGSIGFLEK